MFRKINGFRDQNTFQNVPTRTVLCAPCAVCIISLLPDLIGVRVNLNVKIYAIEKGNRMAWNDNNFSLFRNQLQFRNKHVQCTVPHGVYVAIALLCRCTHVCIIWKYLLYRQVVQIFSKLRLHIVPHNISCHLVFCLWQAYASYLYACMWELWKCVRGVHRKHRVWTVERAKHLNEFSFGFQHENSQINIIACAL